MAPVEVNEHNILEVWNNLRRTKNITKHVPPRFGVGEAVRMCEKSYTSGWGDEIFFINKVIHRKRPVYTLNDYNGEHIEGTFYEEELQLVRVHDKTLFRIDKILKSDGKGRRRRVYVSWKGHGPQFDSWIPASEVKRLK